ncbi:NUDIX hydrolase [Pseudonocardiaceae bacterium YIM PH 21723]|nr:NUDIX hydrolase [Pseudonocardiaceae bacterium YIM PH 21723]
MTSAGETAVLCEETSTPWRRLDSVVVHRNPWFEVRQDLALQPDGRSGTYSHVVAGGSVTVLAIDEQDRLAVTRQWIYTHAGTQWRLPGGGIDPSDSGALAAGRRELAEETGLRAVGWRRLGAITGADSFTNHVDHIFLATGLTMHERSPEPTEADLVVRWMPFTEVLDLVTSGEIAHAGSAFAVLRLAMSRARGCPFPTRSGR